jgi:hypothetical protein
MIHRPPHTAFPVLFATQFSFAGCPVLAERQYPTLRAVDEEKGTWSQPLPSESCLEITGARARSAGLSAQDDDQ